MANDIGPINLKVTASAEGLKSTLDKASATMQAFANAAKSAVSNTFAGGMHVEGAIAKAFGDPGRFLADNILGGMSKVASAVPVVGALLALPFEGAAAGVNALMDAYDKGATHIRALGAASKTVNMDVADFQVLAAITPNTEMAARAMIKFQHGLTAAAMAGEGADNVFAKLGLNAMSLAEKGGLNAFAAFSDKIKGLKDSFLQTFYAQELFGKSAGAIMPALLRGSDGINKIKGMLSGFGLGISEKDVANMKAISDAGMQFSFLKQGFFNQIALGVSPILAQFMESIPRLDQMGITFKGLHATIINVAEGIAKAGAAAWEMWKDPSLFTNSWGAVTEYLWAAFKANAFEVIDAIGEHFAEMAEAKMSTPFIRALGKGVDFMGGIQETLFDGWAKVFSIFGAGKDKNSIGAEDDTGAGLGKSEKARKDMEEAWKKMEGISGKLEGTDSFKFLGDQFEKIRKRSSAFQDENKKTIEAIERLKNIPGQSDYKGLDETIEKLKKVGEEARKNDISAIWIEKASALKRSLRTPLDEWKDKTNELRGMLKSIPDQLAVIGGTNPLGTFDALMKMKGALGSIPNELSDIFKSANPFANGEFVGDARGKLGGIFGLGVDMAEAFNAGTGRLRTQGLGTFIADIFKSPNAMKAILGSGFDMAAAIGSVSGGTPRLIAQAMGRDFAELGSKIKLPEVKFAGAASIDSTAAYSSIINFKFGDQGITVQERIEQLQREALQQSEIQTRNGVELLRILKDNPEALAGII